MSTKGIEVPDIEIAQLTDRLMRRIHGLLNADAGNFDTHKVGPAGGMLLLTVADHEPARIQDIVNRVARDKSQITRALQSLERKGLLERRDVPEDRRGSQIFLTAEGKQTVRELQDAVASALDEILSPLSSEDREALRSVLKKL